MKPDISEKLKQQELSDQKDTPRSSEYKVETLYFDTKWVPVKETVPLCNIKTGRRLKLVITGAPWQHGTPLLEQIEVHLEKLGMPLYLRLK